MYVILFRLAVRVIGCDGSGSMLDVVSALEWVHTHVQMPAVVLMSLGGSVATVLDAAAQSLTDIGVTVVVAGGNAASGECLTSPNMWACHSILTHAKQKIQCAAADPLWELLNMPCPVPSCTMNEGSPDAKCGNMRRSMECKHFIAFCPRE